MSNSGEESPDWLRSFQVPTTHSTETLSSGSESSHNGDLSGEEKAECQESSPPNLPDEDESLSKILEESVAASSSSKRLKRKSPKKEKEVEDPIPQKKKKLENSKERQGNSDDVEVAEEEALENHIKPHVSSSTLPLVLSEKVQRSKALLECEGDSIDLSGDMGVVGRVIISDPTSSNPALYLDLKGTVYETTIVPSRTFCVVSFGQSEAKIEAIMNDFIQLKPRSNVYEAETMLEGTLDGYSFGSEDEGDKLPKPITHQTDQNEDGEEQTKGKGKAKAEKASKVVRKRGKTAGGKPQPAKKARKKTQVSKKSKSKK